MGQNPVTLNLSDEVYEAVRRVAEESNRPVEDVLLESVGVFFGDLSGEVTLANLPNYTDTQLWALVHRRLSKAHLARLGDLNAKGKRGALSTNEEQEIEQLIHASDQLMLLRSKALHLLQDRGHDIKGYLGMRD